MNKYMLIQAKNNSYWVLNYDRSLEITKLKSLFLEKNILERDNISIVDIGCGNGRSALLLLDIFGSNAKITGIDKCFENIQCARDNVKNNNITFHTIDAFDFFSKKEFIKKFDIAFFSWSLFDMSDEPDFHKKKNDLHDLIESVKKSLSSNGIIVVLQPTKGGIFEQLLSDFMPGSDADYKLVHDFLIESGFSGGTSPFPSQNDPWAIWSTFNYKNKEDLFLGVASIVFLEQEIKISREYFDKILNNFLKKHNCDIENLKLTDCVNLYYLNMEDCK